MLTATAALLLCLVALAAVPVDLIFFVQRRASFRKELSLGWMWGLIRIPVTGWRKRARPRVRKRAAKPRFASRAVSALRYAAFRRRLLHFAGGIFRSLHARNLVLRLRFGMDDPADTGRLWALACGVIVPLRIASPAVVDVAPEFAGECLELDAGGTIRFVPARLAIVSMLFLLSPATLRAVWAMRRR
jgi:hypothetical protein